VWVMSGRRRVRSEARSLVGLGKILTRSNSLKGVLKPLAFRVPFVGRLLAERDALLRACGPYGPGHYYSPIPDREAVLRDTRLWDMPRTIPGIDLREDGQLRLLDDFARYYKDLPFPEDRTPPRRYYLRNTNFVYADGITLYAMLRHVKPRRVIEIGSGFSSAAMLDTIELFLGGAVSVTCIDPDPGCLNSLLRPDDRLRATVIERRVQDLPPAIFQALEAGDILFIDGSHVAKIGSDVNYLLGEVLPALRVGVFVHIHDVPYPFEYFREWIRRGLAWNEAYMVRAFLTFNSAYEIVFFNSFLEHFHRVWFEQHMPLCLENTGGSLWLRRVAA
jgi:predicted O-methyltransferase YrrM